MNIVDLSMKIQNDMPFFPGDPIPNLIPALTLERNGCHVTALNIGSHTGTHVDAPSHFINNGKTIDQIPLEHFCGKGLVIHLPNLKFHHCITPEDVKPYIDKLDDIEIVLIHTGWDKYIHSNTLTKHPFISSELAQLFVEHNIKAVGVDMLNVDSTQITSNMYMPDLMQAHNILLSNQILIIENLTNLDKITFDNPFIMFFPLFLADGDGSPVRAIAIEHFVSS